MADLVVDGLEVVEIEDDERQVALVAVGTRHLSAKRVVEVALVEEAGQRVRLRELPRLAVPTRVLDRGDGALGEVFGLLDVLLGRLGIRLPPEKRERADRAELPAHERDENTAPDEVGARGFTLVPVAVADRDRPRQSTGHSRGRWLGRLLRGHPAGRGCGVASLSLDDHHRRLDPW